MTEHAKDSPNAPATDEELTPEEIKRWGSAKNARAAANARKAAKERPVSDEEEKGILAQMSRGERMKKLYDNPRSSKQSAED